MTTIVKLRGARGYSAAEQLKVAGEISDPTTPALIDWLRAPTLGADAAGGRADAAADNADAKAALTALATVDAVQAKLDVEGLLTANVDLLQFRERAHTGALELDGDATRNVEIAVVESTGFAIDFTDPALFDAYDKPVRLTRDGYLVCRGLVMGDPAIGFARIDTVFHPYNVVYAEGPDGAVFAEAREGGEANIFGVTLGSGGSGGGGGGSGQPVDASYTSPSWTETV